MKNKPAILDWVSIIGLSAVWSSAFVFIKQTTPIFGAVGLVFMRLFISAIILSLLFIRPKHFKTIRDNLVPVFIVGATNVTIPFMFFALSAYYINAGSMAVVNGSTPLFAFLFSILLPLTHSVINPITELEVCLNSEELAFLMFMTF